MDKFTFRVPTDRLYHPDGLWVLAENGAGSLVRVGLTDYLQQRSGDAAFVTVRPAGTHLARGDDLAELETLKVSLALPAPVSGTVVEADAALAASPELVNQDPYGDGWLARLEPSQWAVERAALLTPEAYFEHMRREAAIEVGQT